MAVANNQLVGGLYVLVTPLIQKSANLAYTGIRKPFAMLEDRLPEGSTVRTGLHAVLRTVDSSTEQVLRHLEGDPQSAHSTDGSAEPAGPHDNEADREAIEQAVRERQPEVGELADPDLDVADVQARLQAKHAIETREQVDDASDDVGGLTGR